MSLATMLRPVESAFDENQSDMGYSYVASSNSTRKQFLVSNRRMATPYASGFTIESEDVAVMPGVTLSVDALVEYAEGGANPQVALKWRQHLFAVDSPTDVDAISETIEHVFEEVSKFGPTIIDLRGVASNNVNAEHLVAVLRATYVEKEVIPGWAHALREASGALLRAKLDPQEVLVGLN